MSKRLFCVAFLLVSFVLLPKGYAEPRDGWSLEARVPAPTLALFTMEGVGRWGEHFEKTAIAGLFREPEMKAFMAPIEEAIAEQFGSERSPLGEAGPMIVEVLEQLAGLRGQIAIALLDVDMDAGMPRAAASLDFGEHVGDFVKFMIRMRKQLDPQGEAISQFEKDGRTWWQMQRGGPPITATTVDTAFVLATDPTLLESVIAGAGAESLASSQAFQSVRRRASAGGELGMLAYANVPAIVDMLKPMMDDEARVIANALGLDTIQAAAYGMAFAGDGFMDSLVLHAPGADHGLVTMVEMPAFQPQALHLVPANAFYYQEGSFNIHELVPNIRRLGAGVSPEFAEEMDQGLAHLRGMLGVDLEKDILGGLAGPTMVYLSMPETGGLYPELGIFLKVKDPAASEAAFERLNRGIAGAITEEGDVIASTRKLDYRGKTLHLFEMQEARGDDVVPFTPTWTMLDDWLVLTLVPHSMKEIVLRSATATTDGGLAAQEDFQSLRALMPKDAGAFEYLDLQGVLNLLYDTGVPLLQTVAKPNVMGRQIPFPLDWAQLPAARTVRPYFRSMAFFTTWNRDGIAIHMHGPIPLAGVMVAAVAVAIPFFSATRMSTRAMDLPDLVVDTGKEEAKKKPGPRPLRPMPPAGPARIIKAQAHAAQIGRYVRTFMLTENRLPSDLQELVSSGTVGRLPKDPWGQAYTLRVIDKRTRRFQVISAGPDGLFDTADDVRTRK